MKTQTAMVFLENSIMFEYDVCIIDEFVKTEDFYAAHFMA